MVDAFCVLPQVLCHLAFTVTSSLGASINVNLLLQNVILFKKGQNQREKKSEKLLMSHREVSQTDMNLYLQKIVLLFLARSIKRRQSLVLLKLVLAICVIDSAELNRSLKDQSSILVIILQIEKRSLRGIRVS